MDETQTRVQNCIGSWSTGKFMLLVCKSLTNLITTFIKTARHKQLQSSFFHSWLYTYHVGERRDRTVRPRLHSLLQCRIVEDHQGYQEQLSSKSCLHDCKGMVQSIATWAMPPIWWGGAPSSNKYPGTWPYLKGWPKNRGPLLWNTSPERTDCWDAEVYK